MAKRSRSNKSAALSFGILIVLGLAIFLGVTQIKNRQTVVNRAAGVEHRSLGGVSVPEGPDCTLTPKQIGVAAILARYGVYSATANKDWTWVTEAIAVGLAESDGRCNDSYPSTNSWGLWEIDAQNAHMSVSNSELFDPLTNAKAMWSIYQTRLSMSRASYGTNWGAYWAVGRPGAPRFFKNSQFYGPAQTAVASLKKTVGIYCRDYWKDSTQCHNALDKKCDWATNGVCVHFCYQVDDLSQCKGDCRVMTIDGEKKCRRVDFGE